jgi:hypothetical protein
VGGLGSVWGKGLDRPEMHMVFNFLIREVGHIHSVVIIFTTLGQIVNYLRILVY